MFQISANKYNKYMRFFSFLYLHTLSFACVVTSTETSDQSDDDPKDETRYIKKKVL